MSKNILIMGYGIVGHNLANEISDLKPDVVDKYKTEYNTIRDIHYDLGFICVDTPLKGDTLDISEVVKCLDEYDCEIYCIKSTCPVGTVEALTKKTGKKIVFSPEYAGNTKNCNNFNFDFTILGGNPKVCEEIIQMLLPCYDGRHTFRAVEPKLAELVKFMENSYLAIKVSFCNSFFNVCEKEGINYSQLRELFILDPRVNPSHTFVFAETPFWNSHCLNKDVPAIANQYDMSFLQSLIRFNESQKELYKKEEIRVNIDTFISGTKNDVICDLSLAKAIQKRIREVYPDIDDETLTKYFERALAHIRKKEVNNNRKISRARRLSLEPGSNRWNS